MVLRLCGRWQLSTEHPASSNGVPVLVRRETGQAFGPSDIVELYPSYGLLPARRGVARLARATGAWRNDLNRLLDGFLRE